MRADQVAAPLSVGELASRAGVRPDTIRYYERAGVLPPPRRSDGDHRRYGAADLDRLLFVRGAQRLGLRLAEIRQLMAVRETDKCACEPAAGLLQGNDYYTPSPDWWILWGPASYPSLTAWRTATGQEIVNGQPAGLSADPDLTGPMLGLRATAWNAAAASGFRLRPGSPLIGSGLDLSRLFSVDPGPTDFSGAPASVLHPNIWAQ
jgi:DNA-binding transcriptional MerR regulator